MSTPLVPPIISIMNVPYALRRVLTIDSDYDQSENVALSPDGVLLALWASDGHLSLKLTDTGQHVVEAKTEDELQTVLWNPAMTDSTYGIICGYASGIVGVLEYSMVKVC
ncbi:MAG TPA: hypothetical protein VGO47_12915 [Chlamydiales bacterium]|nr:hypothetical protein [Chlamydiales bacterium]